MAILIHEYDHMLTWNEAGLTISDTCPSEQFYFKPHGGCYNADSYLNLCYHEFWKEYDEKWLYAGNRTAEERIAFYEKNKDSFTTIYATVNPYEDIAESFSFFILTPYNDSEQTEAERKLNFFY